MLAWEMESLKFAEIRNGDVMGSVRVADGDVVTAYSLFERCARRACAWERGT